MTFAWELFLAAVCAAVVIGPGYIVGKHQLDQRRHQRTLANIARLERELGYDVPLEQRIDRELGFSYYVETAVKPPPVPVKRVYGMCGYCHTRVALNEGVCQVGRNVPCAKRLYESERRR